MSVYLAAQPLPLFVGGDRFSRQFRDAPVAAPSNALHAFDGASPPTDATVDAGPLSVSVEFYVTSAGSLNAIRWWQPTTGSDGTARQVALYDVATNQVVAPVTGSAPAAPGWQETAITPYALTPTTRYRAVVFHPAGQYAATADYFTALPDITNGILVVPGAPNATSNRQGCYDYAGSLSFPNSAFNSGNYWVDVSVTAG